MTKVDAFPIFENGRILVTARTQDEFFHLIHSLLKVKKKESGPFPKRQSSWKWKRKDAVTARGKTQPVKRERDQGKKRRQSQTTSSWDSRTMS